MARLVTFSIIIQLIFKLRALYNKNTIYKATFDFKSTYLINKEKKKFTLKCHLNRAYLVLPLSNNCTLVTKLQTM